MSKEEVTERKRKIKTYEELEFSDDACKIVLSAKGEADDVSPEMRQFLTYLKEHRAESDFQNGCSMRWMKPGSIRSGGQSI